MISDIGLVCAKQLRKKIRQDHAGNLADTSQRQQVAQMKRERRRCIGPIALSGTPGVLGFVANQKSIAVLCKERRAERR